MGPKEGDVMATLRTDLHSDELTSLRALAAAQRMLDPAISPEHRRTLLGYGYATMMGDALEITPVGQAKVVYETTRESWFPSA
jgi:hypothetical protein